MIHISSSGSVATESVFHHNLVPKLLRLLITQIVLYFSIHLKTPAFQREFSFSSKKKKSKQPITLHKSHTAASTAPTATRRTSKLLDNTVLTLLIALLMSPSSFWVSQDWDKAKKNQNSCAAGCEPQAAVLN